MVMVVEVVVDGVLLMICDCSGCGGGGDVGCVGGVL